jgi:hypothetical protein
MSTAASRASLVASPSKLSKQIRAKPGIFLYDPVCALQYSVQTVSRLQQGRLIVLIIIIAQTDYAVSK